MTIPGAAVIGTPTSFTVTVSYGGKSAEIIRFDKYVQRVMEITAAQAQQVATAVVKQSDGTIRHVPTYVYT